MSRTPTEGSKPLPDPYDFSLVLGDALELLVRRILVISLFAWLSLLIRSILGGRAWGDAVRVPFLVDIRSGCPSWWTSRSRPVSAGAASAHAALNRFAFIGLGEDRATANTAAGRAQDRYVRVIVFRPAD